MEDLERAKRKLGRNKAVGIDLVKDAWIRDNDIWKKTRWKILQEIQKLIKSRIEDIPKYLFTSRFVFLSKDETNYPEYPKVRCLAMINAIAKLLV